MPGSALLDEATTLAARIAGFEPTALMEVKRALDHIPAQISDWAGAMRHGQTVNAAIRQRSPAAAASKRPEGDQSGKRRVTTMSTPHLPQHPRRTASLSDLLPIIILGQKGARADRIV